MKQNATDVPVSAVLITLDAERWLDTVLEPLHCCDEILILDSGSRDRTCEIAARHGVAWHEHAFDGYGPQKRRAVKMARHDWVLSMDADEVLAPATVEAITAIIWSRQDLRTCWKIRRRPFIGDREIRHGHWVPDPVVRLFNRRAHNFNPSKVHESVDPTGPIHTLPGAMLHHSYPDLGALFRADYHHIKAADYRGRGRRTPGALNLAGRASWAFFYSLVFKRGLLDGAAGVVVALSGAVNAVLGLALAGENSEKVIPKEK